VWSISNQTLVQRLIDTAQDLRASIVRNQEWDASAANLHSLDLAQLVLGLGLFDAVDGEAALNIVDETEVLAGLVDGDDIHEAGGVGGIGADLAIDLDEALHHDHGDLLASDSILQSVSEEDNQRQAVASLVRTGGGFRSIGTLEFVEHPMRWSRQSHLMLLWSATHLGGICREYRSRNV